MLSGLYGQHLNFRRKRCRPESRACQFSLLTYTGIRYQTVSCKQLTCSKSRLVSCRFIASWSRLTIAVMLLSLLQACDGLLKRQKVKAKISFERRRCFWPLRTYLEQRLAYTDTNGGRQINTAASTVGKAITYCTLDPSSSPDPGSLMEANQSQG